MGIVVTSVSYNKNILVLRGYSRFSPAVVMHNLSPTQTKIKEMLMISQ